MIDKYIETYKKIFMDDEFKLLLESFTFEKWENLCVNGKLEIIKKVEKLTAKQFSSPAIIIGLGTATLNENGFYDINDNKILISEETINSNAFLVLSIYFHEKRHEYQLRAMNGLVEEDKEFIEKLKANNVTTPISQISSYRKNRSWLEYMYQPIEQDAYKCGNEIACMLGNYIENTLKIDDKGFSEYLEEYDNYENLFKPTNPEIIKTKDGMEKRIDKENKIIMEMFVQEEKVVKKLYKGEEVDLGFLKSEHFRCLFNPETYHTFPVEGKIVILNESIKRSYGSINHNIKLTYNDKGQICINGKCFQQNDWVNQLEEIGMAIVRRQR